MKKVQFSRMQWALLASVATVSPVGAFAQGNDAQPASASLEAPDAHDSSIADVGDIVVTARRREETLQDVPVSVSVTSQAQLEQRSITNAESLDRLDPALQITTNSGSRQSFSPAIRAQRGDKSVISYFAEVAGLRPQYFDLDSIQVLKGPQGTLFGETATGGVLLYTPKRPGNELEGYFSAEAGNYGYTAFEGALNVPIVPDLWSVRVSGQVRRRDGYTTVYFSQPSRAPVDADNLNTTDLRVTSLLKPFDGLEIETMAAYSRNQLNGTGYIKNGIYDYLPSMRTVPAASAATAARFAFFSGQNPPAGQSWLQLEQAAYARQLALGNRVSFASNGLETDQRYIGVSNIVRWQISPNIAFKNITGFTTSSYGPNSGLNPDASDYPVADNLGNLGGICIQGVSPTKCRVDGADTWTNEAQLQGDFFGGRLNAQTGFYYRNLTDSPWTGPSQFVVLSNSSAVPAASCTTYGLAGTPCLTLTRTKSKSYAIYGQATLEIIKDVRLTGGVRRTWDKPVITESTAGPVIVETFDGVSINLSPFGAAPLAGAKVNSTETPENRGTSYTLGIDWRVTDSILLWGTHRRGYKGGGVNRNTPTTDPNFAYGPETVTDFEVGIRANGTLSGIPFSATLVGFRSKYDDIQRATFGQVGDTYISFTQNVAAATIQGLEFSGSIKPSEYFVLNGSAAYTDATFDRWLETSTCARETFRAGCGGVASSTVPVFIDHVAGTVTAAGVTQTYTPDVFSQAPKFRFTLSPTLKLGFLGEGLRGASLTANIVHSSSYASQDSNFIRGLTAKDVLSPSRTLVDLRFDWRDLGFTDLDVDLFAAITNLTNFDKPVAVLDSTSVCDCVLANYHEPRMFYAGFAFHF